VAGGRGERGEVELEGRGEGRRGKGGDEGTRRRAVSGGGIRRAVVVGFEGGLLGCVHGSFSSFKVRAK